MDLIIAVGVSAGLGGGVWLLSALQRARQSRSLLDGAFAAFHFGDRISEDRLDFDYRLHPGVARSRNAVALLRLLGAPEAAVVDALDKAGLAVGERSRETSWCATRRGPSEIPPQV